MKKKLLVLSVLATLSLVGCGGGNNRSEADLPEGGKEVDVTGEQGQAELSKKLKSAAEAIATTNPTAVHASLENKGYNLDVGAQVTMTGMLEASASLKVQNLGAKLALDASKHSAQDSSLDAKLALSDVSGSLALGGDVKFLAGGLVEEEEKAHIDQKLDLSGLSAAAYVTGGKAYADLSGTKTVVDRVSALGNGLLDNLKNTTLGQGLPMLISMAVPGLLDSQSKFQLNTFLDSYLTAGRKIYVTLPEEAAQSLVFPEIPSKEQIGEMIDFDQLAQMVATYQPVLGYKFKTYDNGAFGLQLNVNKASLITAIETFAQFEGEAKTEFEASINKYLNSLELGLSVYFNEKALLDKVGLKFSVDAKVPEMPLPAASEGGESMGKVSVTLKASGESALRFSFDNSLVQLPSDLNTYQEIELPEQGGEVEPEPEPEVGE